MTGVHEALLGLTMWLALGNRAGGDAVGNGGKSERGGNEHSGFLLAFSDLSPGATPVLESAQGHNTCACRLTCRPRQGMGPLHHIPQSNSPFVSMVATSDIHALGIRW